MTPKELIDAFEILADAPDGVSRLRELVLQLAVQGKLVPQDQNDEPAQAMLKRISDKKKRLIVEQKIKKPKQSPPLDLDATPFGVPPGWQWVRLIDAGIVVMGNSPPGNSYNESGDGVPLINGPVEFSSGHFGPTVKSKFTTAPNQMCVKGDLLVCVRGATTGRTNIAAFDACIGRGVALVRTFDAQPYTNIFMWHIGQELLAAGKGTTFPSISYVDLAGKPFPFPPHAEQGRIVAKVDKLMALLDRLEAAQGSREATRQALRDAALSALRDADDPEIVESAWTRISDRMDDLFTSPTDIPLLRQTIFQLAVRGRLVSQDPADQPAEELLSCMAGKADGSGGKKRPRGNGQPLGQDAGPFELPDGWAWSTVDRLGDITGGGTPSKNEPRFWGGDIPWVSPKDMKRPYIGESIDTVTPAAVAGSSAKEIEAGALLMVVRGMILAHSFPTAVTTRVVTVNQDMKALIPVEKEMGPYLLLATNGLKSEVLNLVERSTHGTCKLPTAKLFGMPIPIPPLAEQRRIVSKVKELTTLCDRLEARLECARDTRASFATSAVGSLS